MGESLEQRAELASQLAELTPDEVPLNFLNPRPGTPFGDLPVMSGTDALRTIAAFRLALPRTILRYAGGREITLGDLGTRDGMLGGINAVIVGNYLTTLGRSPRRGPRAAGRPRHAGQGALADALSRPSRRGPAHPPASSRPAHGPRRWPPGRAARPAQACRPVAPQTCSHRDTPTCSPGQRGRTHPRPHDREGIRHVFHDAFPHDHETCAAFAAAHRPQERDAPARRARAGSRASSIPAGAHRRARFAP